MVIEIQKANLTGPRAPSQLFELSDQLKLLEDEHDEIIYMQDCKIAWWI